MFVHNVGQNKNLYHQLTVSLRWALSLTDHARLFVAILHGDYAGAGLLLTGSTTVSAAARGAGLVGPFFSF